MKALLTAVLLFFVSVFSATAQVVVFAPTPGTDPAMLGNFATMTATLPETVDPATVEVSLLPGAVSDPATKARTKRKVVLRSHVVAQTQQLVFTWQAGVDVTANDTYTFYVYVPMPDGNDRMVAAAAYKIQVLLDPDKLKAANNPVTCRATRGGGVAEAYLVANGGSGPYTWWVSEGTAAVGGYEYNHGAVAEYWLDPATASGKQVEIVAESKGQYGTCTLAADAAITPIVH